MTPLPSGEGVGDDVDGRRRTEHAHLHHVEIVGGGGRFDLVGDDLRFDRDEPVRPPVLRIERDDAGDGADSVDTQLLESLQIDLDPGAASRFRTGDDICKINHSSSLRLRNLRPEFAFHEGDDVCRKPRRARPVRACDPSPDDLTIKPPDQAIQTVLMLQNSCMPWEVSSRPLPDRLIPPNPSSGYEVVMPLMNTWPDSIRSMN
ncbi:Uncharacterised protein [Mycobacteroides abscessus subsp. abscessus]|nr:Uncharacterised protein [Mycobacteroides abscessus subsp. abscessus]